MPSHALRIALVGPIPPPSGGMANQTAQLKRLLEAEGLTVELVPVNAPYRPAIFGKIPGLRALVRLCLYLPSLWQAFGRNDLVHLMANSGWSWHLFAAPAILMARLRGRPVVVNYRGGEAQTFLEKQARFVVPVLRRAQVLAVPSGFLEAVFEAYGVSAQIVPNIVDRQRFYQATELPDVPHLVVTRNLEPIYDIPTALRAFAQVHPLFPLARLTIAGSGPELAHLQALCQQLNIAEAVSFCGRLDPDGVAALYRSATLMINPSTVDNMPNSVLEALACGVPVLSTDVGGVPYVVRHGQTALLVPSGNPEVMAEALRVLLSDKDVCARLRAQGLQDVAAYEWSAVKARWLTLYRDLLSA